MVLLHRENQLKSWGDGYDVLEGKAKVMERSGNDVTELYINGAMKTLNLAQEMQASHVVLKEYSPSCSKEIYSGEFVGKGNRSRRNDCSIRK